MSAAAGRRVFVTGGAGLVGRSLVATLAARGHAVRSLSRLPDSDGNPGAASAAAWETGTVDVVAGDLRRPEGWRGALDGCEVVVHLAARTGKAPPAAFVADNVDGSRLLLEACGAAGVARFLFVSSIAARFPARPDYPYARSKAAAEALVGASGLRFTTVRPTIVVGAGSGSLGGLVKLADLPVMPLLGGGATRVEPIWVGDLAFLLRRIVDRDRFDGETLEIGGPEALPIGDLLRRIRRLRGGSDRAVSLPARPLLALLTAAEKIARPLLPVTAGQLASFVHDGTTEKNSLVAEARDELLTVDQMLRASGVGDGAGPARASSPAAGGSVVGEAGVACESRADGGGSRVDAAGEARGGGAEGGG